MKLQKTVFHVFLQLSDSLNQLSDEQYLRPCNNLSGHTIGQHVRHIIEMYQCLEAGYENGDLDYESRKRDHRIEADKIFALGLLKTISQQIDKPNRPLSLLTYYDDVSPEPVKISTNYFREIAYNLEHTIHHMALIRVGLREIGQIQVAESYGVASSTLKYRQQCAQ